MEVKCPKCRFRHEEDVPRGCNEIASVCPRCGTPFTVPVATPVSEHPDYVASAEEPSPAPQTNSGQPKPLHSPSVSENAVQINHGKAQTPKIIHTIPSRGNSPKANGKGSRFAAKGAALTAALVFTTAFFAYKSCGETRSYTSESLSMDKGSSYPNEQKAYSISEEDGSLAASGTSAPKWVYGTWMVDTKYGQIKIVIRGNRITETSGGGTSSGTFVYDGGMLLCDFGDGNIFTYRLLEEEERIDAGDGLLMQKED